MAVVARNSTLMCLKDRFLIRKTSDEKWRHAVVEGLPPGNALWVLTSGSTKLVDFSADTKKLDGIRLPKSVPVDSAATADRSVHGVFSPGELEAAAQALDSDAGARVHIPSRRSTVQGAEGDWP